jgi:NAD(P)-dependent dehydrogenase (short-subunit alcohol dehydrogenase family)
VGKGEVLGAPKTLADFKGRTLLLSGATGIAASTAMLALAAEAQVFVVSLEEGDCRALMESAADFKGQLATMAGDLRARATADAAVKACVERFGRVDMLFNVAGLSGRRFGDGPIHECSDEGYTLTVEGNLQTLFWLSRAGLRQMLQQDTGPNGLRGSVLHMGSVMAASPQRDHFATHAYAAAKGAITSLTKAMASYYAPHKIRVNAIAPGLVRTPMSARAQSNDTILDFMQHKQPLAEALLDPEDVARTALLLLSDAARMVTGEVLAVDGGWQVSQ